ALGEHLLDHPEQRLACDLVAGLRAVDQRLDFLVFFVHGELRGRRIVAMLPPAGLRRRDISHRVCLLQQPESKERGSAGRDAASTLIYPNRRPGRESRARKPGRLSPEPRPSAPSRANPTRRPRRSKPPPPLR